MSVRGGDYRAQFSQPVRQIVMMLVVIIACGAGIYLIYPRVAAVFAASPWINATIGIVFVIGVAACFLQVFQLISAVHWIEDFARGRPGFDIRNPPGLLAPLAALLRSRGLNRQISSTSATSIRESVATRIEEARDVTRYLVNLLIFLGLLGTFYGLATTVPAVVETIRSLAPKEGETGVQVFEKLMGGLEAQLGGMGTAFGSSLLGLAGSLVVGLLELFSSRGQNRFYRELEEWLTTITRLGFAGGDSEMSGEAGALIAVLDHMAEQMEGMRETQTNAEASRGLVDDKLTEVAMAVTALTRTMQHGARSADLLERIAEGQERLHETQRQILQRPAPAREAEAPETGGDAEARMRLRSIDVQLLRILEEMAAGRQETVAELRVDIAALIRELRRSNRHASAGEPGVSGSETGPEG